MNQTPPEHLFKKYALGECTEGEKAIIEAWYLFRLQEVGNRPTDQKIQSAKEEAWKAIMPPVKRFPLYPWLAVAGVAIAVLLAFLFQSESVSKAITQAEYQSNQVAQNATTLSASQVENSMMKLADGSTVILEKGSTLTLSADFNRTNSRKVALVGKAFFDIKHNPERPFVIQSGVVNTTVLGTAFDITSRAGSKSVKINVIRGLVKVEDTESHWTTVLPKNYQVEFNGEEPPRKLQIDAAKELSWNQADLEFNDISLADAQSRLEAQFGYKLNIGDAAMKDATFSYSMRRKEPMESFMKSICAFIGADYTIDHKNKIISIEPLNQ